MQNITLKINKKRSFSLVFPNSTMQQVQSTQKKSVQQLANNFSALLSQINWFVTSSGHHTEILHHLHLKLEEVLPFYQLHSCFYMKLDCCLLTTTSILFTLEIQ